MVVDALVSLESVELVSASALDFLDNVHGCRAASALRESAVNDNCVGAVVATAAAVFLALAFCLLFVVVLLFRRSQ